MSEEAQVVDPTSSEDKALEPIKPLMDKEESEEFLAYVRGESATPPACITKVMTSIANKLTMVAGCDMVSTINREQILDKFMLAAEQRLFSSDPERLTMMDDATLGKLYEKASKRKDILSESRRKFLAQNRDSMSIQGSEQEKLLAAIMAMSPEQVEKLKSAVAEIQAEVVENPEETSPDSVAADLAGEEVQ